MSGVPFFRPTDRHLLPRSFSFFSRLSHAFLMAPVSLSPNSAFSQPGLLFQGRSFFSLFCRWWRFVARSSDPAWIGRLSFFASAIRFFFPVAAFCAYVDDTMF